MLVRCAFQFARGRKVYSQQHPIPREEELRLEHEGSDKVDDYSDGCHSSHDFCKHPFPVVVGMRFVCGVQVYAVEACNGNGEDELEKAQDDAQYAADDAARAATEAVRDGDHGRWSK